MAGFSHRNKDSDGRAVTREYLRYLARHPRTAQHVCQRLSTKFVHQDPPAALVRRLAKVYLANDTEIVPVLRALVASKEFRAAAGKKLYDTSCAGCHGQKAQGGLGVNLKDASTWKYDLFKRALKQGKDDKGVALKPIMPKFPQLTDDQMKSLQMHIKAVTK